jgi:hypothetical protein
MKLLYKSGATCIVKINSNVVYYGNGKDLNSFGNSALQFLRFNPYMNYVENEDLPIPRDIEEYIQNNYEEYSNRAKSNFYNK